MVGGRRIADIALPATSHGTGTKQTTVLDPLDLSRARQLKLNLKVTAAASTGADNLDVKLQDTVDGVTWNTRVRFNAVLGSQAASPTAPFVQEAVLTNAIALQAAEKVYTTSGSAGGTDLAAGTVLDGPFNPPYRDGVTTGTRASAWQVVFAQTDGSGLASFTAALSIQAVEEDVP